MAKETNDKIDFKLPARTLEELGKMERSIKSTRSMMQTLKGLGVDISDLEAKLTWAEETRKTLLKEFG